MGETLGAPFKHVLPPITVQRTTVDPSILLANGGTPLIWASCFMLLIGNYLIGMFEFWLIKRQYGAPFFPGNPMIIANYLSMFAGVGVLFYLDAHLGPVRNEPFRYGLWLIAAMWLLSFVLTILIEWPFVAKCARLKLGKQSLLTTVWVHLASYSALLVIVYFLGSVSTLTMLRQVEPKEIKTVQGWVYFMKDTGDVYRVRLDGSKTEMVTKFKAEPHVSWTRVTVEPTREGDRARLLYRTTQSTVVINDDIGAATKAAPVEYFDSREESMLGNVTFGPGSTRYFTKLDWVYVGFWEREGLVVGDKRYALETPFLAIRWRNPVVLPDRKVVAQFGDMIVLLDHETGRVAELAKGVGGDVLLD